MDIETILRSTIAMLSTCHVLGADSEAFGGALKNLKSAVKAIEKAKEEAKHADCNE
jgi:hypothetical protein